MKEAFLQIINEHQNIVHKVSRMYRDRPADREDLFQDIVYQLWRAYPKFRGESKVSTWIYRIALNTAMAFYRKKRLNVEFQSETIEKIDEVKEASQQEEQLYNALYQLSEPERAIISLYLEDYSYNEIADIIGISENYVGVKINRIKNRLKEILT